MTNNDKIKALSTREQCRDKLPTWFGSRENFLHGFREVLGNAVDEITNNFEQGTIKVTLHDDNQTIEVLDSGRGIPFFGETDGVPNYQLLFETLFAGTNYDNNENGKITVGTNGVGTTVLNHTSTLFKVTSKRDGLWREIEYRNGALERSEVTEDEWDPKDHGSIFTFRLDPEVYTNTIYKPESIRAIIKRVAATANKIKFLFEYKGEVEVYHFTSLEDYFNRNYDNLTSKPAVGKEFAFNRENELNKITILFSSATEAKHESFLNFNWLPEHGSIHDGVIAGVKNFMNKKAKDLKLLDKKSNLTTSDIEDSISYAVSVLSTNVEYANQTKLSTSKKLYRSLVMEYVQSLLEAFEVENQKEFKKLLDHIIQVNKFNNKNTAAKQALKKQLNEKTDTLSNRVDKLVESDKTGLNAELFIAEGDSALGSVVMARDPEWQAAYALRGKILNCMKVEYLKIFENKVIMDLIRSIGTGVVADKKYKDIESFDIAKTNYGKFIIATDADADGQQIACLLITFFYRCLRPLLEAGMVYIAKTPLYEVKLPNDEVVYIFSEAEKEAELAKIKGKYTIARCKGLGELDAETMAYTAMDPTTRILVQVTVEDAQKMVDAVEVFMGTDVEERKQYIEENLHNYVLEID